MRVDGRALVVDDEPLVAELVARRLSQAGFATEVAATARAAARAATSEPDRFDVVLVGERLPDASGMELVHRLRSDGRTAGTSIAVLTVGRDPGETFRMLESGADDVIRKPVDRVELLARVRSLLRIKRQLDELREANRRLEELNSELDHRASTDPLTRLANRRAFETRLTHEVARSHRYGEPLSLLLLDIDHFKHVNDTWGHAAGDDALRHVARLIGDSVRRVDLPARYGGEELVVVAPSTDLEGGRVLAERLRRLVESQPIRVASEEGEGELRLTVSIGVATLEPGQDGDALFAAADGAVYEAKRGGRNRVAVSASPPYCAAAPEPARTPAAG